MLQCKLIFCQQIQIKEHISQRWGKSSKNSFSSQKWKCSQIFIGYGWRTRSGVLAWEAARPATAVSCSALPTHYRYSSHIFKTMMAMRIVVRSVGVMYTKCLPELDEIQTACLKGRFWTLIRRSVINLASAAWYFFDTTYMQNVFFLQVQSLF